MSHEATYSLAITSAEADDTVIRLSGKPTLYRYRASAGGFAVEWPSGRRYTMGTKVTVRIDVEPDEEEL